ncbi:methionine--tRNA ligase [Sporolactobacillus shoreicorticis]|uniref:Methionine--tRNA ligase n=1 Tax=Sporolactobacillus shoreicorticis TaxID=1923877 RepID=A0ABW5S2E2_9BACL|nr:methionine--tRNA ligase [Sporolactobacillus shoreicorticis]MCO7126500.1 methionine--tRNA ligase [Sporolactobacillus shoreicorticis]
MAVLIAGAWPYANGDLHLGHLSSLIPGDCLARYFRQKGAKVLYVSGSDCNGTPITIRAKQEAVSPKTIADRYHDSFQRCFEKLGFTYDCYTRTDTLIHHRVVQDIFRSLYDNGYIYHKKTKQMYCLHCTQFLPDRYVEGSCPHCGAHARGDQCDACSTILDPMDLEDPACKLCGHKPELREVEHLYFALSKFQLELEQQYQRAKKNNDWRENALKLTRRYLDEGLQDRAVTRDLPVGVTVPIKGFEDKKVYVWIEAVSGYYSASVRWGEEHHQDISEFWNEQTVSYYVQGKDNVPFHTIIWPAILIGVGKKALPTHLVSNEYVTLEHKKLSTSRNWAVWAPDILEHYDPDSIRYFLLINAPETHDADFSWKAFIESHNGELLGAYGNFVNRTLKFIEKLPDFNVASNQVDPQIFRTTVALYEKVGGLIESAHLKAALSEIFSWIRRLNKYFDERKPWQTVNTNQASAYTTLNTCVFSIANLAQILAPFLPFSSRKLADALHLAPFKWEVIHCPGKLPKDFEPLFARIDPAQIQVEHERLTKNANVE